MPRGALTATAQRSARRAILYLVVVALQLVGLALERAQLFWWFRAAVAIVFAVVAVCYLRSWRILLAHERRHRAPPAPPDGPER